MMKKLALSLSCLTALAALAPAQSTDAQFAMELAASRETVMARKKVSRGFFGKIIPGSTKLKMKRPLIVETNLGFTVSRMLVSSEFEPGSETIARQDREAAQGFPRGSRYIGYALKVQDLGSGRAGFMAGKYENKSQGHIYGRFFPWGRETYGGPGIVAFEFLPMGPNSAFIQDNGTREFRLDPKDPNSPMVEKRIAPTVYDEGVRQALVVEIAHDDLERLLAGRVEALEGEVRYYIRGGFNREVYDLYPIAPVTTHILHWPLSLKIANQYWDYRDLNKEKLYANDPVTVRELNRLGELRDLLDRIENSEKAGKVLVRLDKTRSDGSANVLTLDFQRQP